MRGGWVSRGDRGFVDDKNGVGGIGRRSERASEQRWEGKVEGSLRGQGGVEGSQQARGWWGLEHGDTETRGGKAPSCSEARGAAPRCAAGPRRIQVRHGGGHAGGGALAAQCRGPASGKLGRHPSRGHRRDDGAAGDDEDQHLPRLPPRRAAPTRPHPLPPVSLLPPSHAPSLSLPCSRRVQAPSRLGRSGPPRRLHGPGAPAEVRFPGPVQREHPARPRVGT